MPGAPSRKARITRGTKGWNGAELVKPTTSRPSSPRAVRRVVVNAWSIWARIARGVGQQRTPGLRQLHPAWQAAQQLHVQLALQRADLLTERRLLHAQPFGGAGYVAFLGDGDEVAEVAKFHLPYPIDMDFAVSILWIDRRRLARFLPGLHGPRSRRWKLRQRRRWQQRSTGGWQAIWRLCGSGSACF